MLVVFPPSPRVRYSLVIFCNEKIFAVEVEDKIRTSIIVFIIMVKITSRSLDSPPKPNLAPPLVVSRLECRQEALPCLATSIPTWRFGYPSREETDNVQNTTYTS
jgi:hypothetical protein